MTPNVLTIVRTANELRTLVQGWRKAGLSVGLVPTMGALHNGHMALIKAAQARCDRVIATIFVNPKQFAVGEDFNTYPRDEDFDRDCMESQGVNVLFAPKDTEMFPNDHMTEIILPPFNKVLEGVVRPGHFNGVATVVAKLLNQAQADHAFFGEKDFQQLQVIRHLAKDLCIATSIHGVPTVRHQDGLALSSRNVYLTVEERAKAPTLQSVLKTIGEGFRGGETAKVLERAGRQKLTNAGFGAIDYLAVVDSKTLKPIKTFNEDQDARVIAAVRLGRTRLIDNIAVTFS